MTWGTPKTTGDEVGLSDRTIRKLCAEGVIRSVIVSRRGDRRIPREEIERIKALQASGGSIFDPRD